MISKELKFFIAIILQLIIIFGIIIFKISILSGGSEVLLRIAPIDPRDPLRGDYLTFEYTISTASTYNFAYSEIKEGDKVYVSLVKSGTYWIIGDKIEKIKPVDSKNIFIKGTVSRVFSGRWNNQQVNIVYGVEQYFIPEGTGRDFDWRKEASARVKIDKAGNAVLKQIYLDDKPWP